MLKSIYKPAQIWYFCFNYDCLMKKKPLILISNDDGIDAPGIRFLINQMLEIGDVVVVAPNSPQSGQGHAISVNTFLEFKPHNNFDGEHLEYSCSGTPADCIKLGVHEILDRKPDLCVSGINHGANSSISVIYSGTMSAALEAGIEGIPSIGFSIQDFSWAADFSICAPFVKSIAQKVLDEGLPEGVVLNVNFPKSQDKPYNGVKICKQARGNWVNKFDKRTNPHGKVYYWMNGKYVNMDSSENTDEAALEDYYVSVVPTQFDLTAYQAMNALNKWDI